MIIFAETERLILRERVPADDKGMFELDNNSKVILTWVTSRLKQ